MASVQNTVLKADAISTEPVYVERLPLGKRMVLFVRLWAFKTFVKVALSLLRYFNYMGLRSLKPTYAKKYPVGAQLENLVWLPSTYKAGSTLPLYIDIHGGGFAISDPEQGRWSPRPPLDGANTGFQTPPSAIISQINMDSVL